MFIATFNGFNIYALPSDAYAWVSAPASIEWDPQEMVAESDQAYGFQDQIFDWQQSMWSGALSFAQMDRKSADTWAAFVLQLRGPVNGFLLGDPLAAIPKGTPSGTPIVSGASQTGYSLVTRGWTPSKFRHLLPGDHLQIGYRLYKVLNQVDSDSSGDATLSIWPNLRDEPADATAITLRNCKGLFRLQNTQGNKWSTNIGSYGLNALQIREAGIA